MKKWVRWLSIISGGAAAVSILAMVSIILLEVILRTVFRTSTLLAQEYAGYLVILFAFFCLAEVLRKGRHIRITLVVSHLPQTAQKVLNLLGSLLALSLVVYMIFWTSKSTILAFQIMQLAHTITETPLFIPKLFIPVGLTFFALQLVVYIAEVIGRFAEVKGD